MSYRRAPVPAKPAAAPAKPGAKAVKPALTGARKARKRTIARAYEPEVFMDKLMGHFEDQAIVQECSMHDPLEVASLCRRIDSDQDLEFNRYGEHFFDQIIAGGLGLCVSKSEDTRSCSVNSMLGCSAEVLPEWSELIEMMTRRRPFFKRFVGEACNAIVQSMHNVPQYQTRIIDCLVLLADCGVLTPGIPK
ncbi:hypothetical protein KIPB_008429, partial [Kipferlia bialata]|eukprot:g8429.t1